MSDIQKPAKRANLRTTTVDSRGRTRKAKILNNRFDGVEREAALSIVTASLLRTARQTDSKAERDALKRIAETLIEMRKKA